MDWQQTDRAAIPEGVVAPLQQHALYGKACAALGARAHHFRLMRAGEVVATALVLARRWPILGEVALLSRGPVWAEGMSPATRAEGTRALAPRLRSGRRCLLATPECDGGADPLSAGDLLPLVTPGHVARVDLSQPATLRRAHLHGKWRNRLVRAEGAGLEVRHAPLPPDPDHWLLRKEAAQARSRGYRGLPARFTHAWTTLGGRDATRLFTAHAGAEPVAAVLVLRHGGSASYHIGWSGSEGRRLHAHNLLIWCAMEWLAKKGHRQLDLGTLDTERAPGLARFKLGAGAEAIRLGATWLDAPGTRLAARLFIGRPRSPQASSSASQ